MNKKIKLKDLKVKSFVTSLDKSDVLNLKVKGGIGDCAPTGQTRCYRCNGPIICEH